MCDFSSEVEHDFPIEVISGSLGDDHYVEFRLGFLIEERQMVIMSVALVEGASFLDGYDGIFDLRFGTRLKYLDNDWKVTPIDFTQSAKKRYIPREHRDRVKHLIARAACGLVERIRPPVITMSTYDAELPDAALVKYRVIEARLHEAGYTTHQTYRDAAGKDRWHFVAAT